MIDKVDGVLLDDVGQKAATKRCNDGDSNQLGVAENIKKLRIIERDS